MAQGTATRPLVAESFDTFQRMAVIREVCAHLSRAGCRSAVDVGGFPGLLASHLAPLFESIHTVDLPQGTCPNYLRGTALALPLRSGSVDVVISSDTLEHVGDADGAIREILRVASRAVVISAPWRSGAADRVEEALVAWHRLLTGRDHPWLTEHRERGLPDRGGVLARFRTANWTAVELACGNLTDWTLFQFAQMLREVLLEGEVDHSAVNEALNRAWPADLSTRIPETPYRTVIVAAADPALLAGLAQSTPHAPNPPAIVTALPLLEAILRRPSDSPQRSVDEVYCERLEALTRQQAAEIESLRRGGGRAGLIRRVLRRFRSLLGGV